MLKQDMPSKTDEREAESSHGGHALIQWKSSMIIEMCSQACHTKMLPSVEVEIVPSEIDCNTKERLMKRKKRKMRSQKHNRNKITFDRSFLDVLTRDNCSCCCTGPGELHHFGCPVEQCPYCGLTTGCHSDGPCFLTTRTDTWPPNARDRIPWKRECSPFEAAREAGYFAYADNERGFVPCTEDEEGAELHVCRFIRDARWDRKARRFVLDPQQNKVQLGKTNLSEALADMEQQGLIAKEMYFHLPMYAIRALNQLATDYLHEGRKVLGYVFYDESCAWHMEHGHNGWLFFDAFQHPMLGSTASLPQIREIIGDCLDQHGVEHEPNEELDKMLYLQIDSIVPIEPQEGISAE